jgi:hypothetical protein
MAKFCGENHQEAEVLLVFACKKGQDVKRKTVDTVLNDGKEGQGRNQQ